MEADICIFYKAARDQREVEVERGEGLVGTIGYETTGCYNCDGKDIKCDRYYSST